MTPDDFNNLTTLIESFGIIGLLISCLLPLISFIITIGLIIAIFQINSRVDQLKRLQQEANGSIKQAQELQQQAFIAQLTVHGPNHLAYLNYLTELGYLTRYQAEFILKQTGQI